jgi:hypothetical protein
MHIRLFFSKTPTNAAESHTSETLFESEENIT